MDQLGRLVAIEAIRSIKGRYWYYLDTKDWAGMESLFSDDAIVDLRLERAFSLGEPGGGLPPVEQAIAAGDAVVIIGAKDIAAYIEAVCGTWLTVHHGSEPIIEITSETEATGIWPLFDYIDDGERGLKAWGHYHEKYRRDGDRWKITSMILTRLRADGEYPNAERLQMETLED